MHDDPMNMQMKKLTSERAERCCGFCTRRWSLNGSQSYELHYITFQTLKLESLINSANEQRNAILHTPIFPLQPFYYVAFLLFQRYFRGYVLLYHTNYIPNHRSCSTNS